MSWLVGILASIPAMLFGALIGDALTGNPSFMAGWCGAAALMIVQELWESRS